MAATETSTRFSEYITSSVARAAPVFVGVLATLALILGWLQRDEEHLTPKSGLGYWLGVCGGGMMMLLLVYSFRKRTPMARALGSIPTWFRIHMLFGVFGPVLVVYHSNFKLGALNSNVALFTMLTVAGSGVIGRYIYGKMHMDLTGRKAVAKEIFADIEEMRAEIGKDLEGKGDLVGTLHEFGRRAIETPPSSALASLFRGALMAAQSRILRAHLRSRLRKLLYERAKTENWSWLERRRRAAEIDTKLSAYFSAILKAMELRFYERLFALWHVLHLPMFFLMLVAGFIHVWAVHRY